MALAAPVLDRVVEDLPGAAVCLVLAAEDGRVLDRRVGDSALRAALDGVFLDCGYVWSEQNVGTNAIGTAIERRRPIVVRGHEHYALPLRGLALRDGSDHRSVGRAVCSAQSGWAAPSQPPVH